METKRKPFLTFLREMLLVWRLARFYSFAAGRFSTAG
jgi:hypothetical protein